MDHLQNRTTRSDVVVLDALRSPIGRRNGSLASLHPAELLARVLDGLLERSGIDPAEVGQVVGSQQATNLASSLIASGTVDMAVACGVEAMSRIPIGSNSNKALGLGTPIPQSYFGHYEFTSQFEGAERIAERWGITRDDTDAFGLASQTRAAAAWAEDRFAGQVLPIDAPLLDGDGNPTGETLKVQRDEGLRVTDLETLAELKPVGRPDGVHTAGSASQISDGAAAILLMSRAKADSLGLQPRARVVDTALVGVDPELMLTGPIERS